MPPHGVLVWVSLALQRGAAGLAHKLWVRIVDVPEGGQPDQLSTGEVQALLKAL